MILVTGGSGVVGHFAIEELLSRGHSVRALVRSGVPTNNVEIAKGDLSDAASLERAMRGVDGVVHAACTFKDSAIDIAAMEKLLNHWRKGPFVFISTLDVYGIMEANPITEEDTVSRNYNDYATGKVVCEEMLQSKGGEFTILRAPYIWGPHPTARKRLLNDRLLHGKDIILPGSTESEWKQYGDTWIDARDLAWIIAECLQHPVNGALNVLSGHFLWHDLYASLIRLTESESAIVHKPLAQINDDELSKKFLYAQTWKFSDEKLKEHLAFHPRYSLEQTLNDTVNASL